VVVLLAEVERLEEVVVQKAEGLEILLEGEEEVVEVCQGEEEEVVADFPEEVEVVEEQRYFPAVVEVEGVAR
jgi:hypothetical protein